jgi:uncharacterized membrane protein
MNLINHRLLFQSTFAFFALLMAIGQPSRAQAGNVPAQYGFQDLGAQWAVMAVSDISEGPLVAVGGQSFGFSQTVRWTQAGGKEVLGSFGRASDVSADGSVIVGGVPEAFRWTASGVELLGDLRTGTQNSSVALGVSRDGSLVVGHALNDTDGQPFIWDANEMTPSMQPLPNFGEPFIGATSFNTAYDVERDSSGSIWVVGDTVGPASGSPAKSAVAWRDGLRNSVFAPSATAPAIAMVPESPGSMETIPLVLVNDLVGSFTVNVSVVRPTEDSMQTLPPSAFIGINSRGNDISSDGRVVVGNGGNVGEAVVWNVNVGESIWGGGTDGQILYDILDANLPPSVASALNFGSWNLTNGVGVTVDKQFVPSLDVDVYRSAIVGQGTNPGGLSSAWLATVYSAPALDAESLVRENLVEGGFESGGTGWTVIGDGTFDQVPSPTGIGLAGRLTTETEVAITQLIDTPADPFVLALDQLFASAAGSAQVSLGGVLLGESLASGAPESDLSSMTYLVADPSLLGQTGLELRITAFGGSTGQIVIDNVSLATTVVPEPSTGLLALMACLPLTMTFRRRQKCVNRLTSAASPGRAL